jgi:hypothetical protein
MEKLIERFKARAADRRVVEILKTVEVYDAGPTFGGPESEPLERLPSFRTTDGLDVNHVEGHEFEVLDIEPFRVRRV